MLKEIFGRMKDSIIMSRIIALIIDLFVIGFVLSFVLLTLFRETFIAIGNYGVLIGFFITLIYFTFSNSNLFRGQSIGKRIMSIWVVNARGYYLNLPEAFFRALILASAIILLDIVYAGLPLNKVSVGIVDFVGNALMLVMIFFLMANRESRQSLHDLVTGSYVIKTNALYFTPSNEVTPKKKRLIRAILIGFAALNMLPLLKEIDQPQVQTALRSISSQVATLEGVASEPNVDIKLLLRGNEKVVVKAELSDYNFFDGNKLGAKVNYRESIVAQIKEIVNKHDIIKDRCDLLEISLSYHYGLHILDNNSLKIFESVDLRNDRASITLPNMLATR